MKIKIALFFDGTCNNKHESIDTMTNVGKLFNVHQGVDIAQLIESNSTDDIPSLKLFKLYIRGVGTKKYAQDLDDLDDDFYENIVFGSAFGAGGHDRTRYTSRRVCELVHAIQSVPPECTDGSAVRIDWDLFGFSRGAALARHFVNVIYLNLWPTNSNLESSGISAKLAEIKHHIRFLGIFDTVGSFGIPGNDIDPYQFDVDNSKVDYIYHLCAEDELRANFDLQSVQTSGLNSPIKSLSSKTGSQLAIDKMENPPLFDTYMCDLEDVATMKHELQSYSKWVVEESYPGVHGDIGGGYGSTFDQGLNNNFLSRIYLRKMHVMALAMGVEFYSIDQCTLKFAESWYLQDSLKQRFEQLIEHYQNNPTLKVKHQIFRCHQRYRDVADYDFKRKNFRFSNYSRIRKKFLRDFDRYRIELVRALLIDDCFDSSQEADIFFQQYEGFRNDYIHTSHFPANGLPGMDAQKAPIDFDAWPAKQLKEQRYYMNLSFQLQRKIY
jgi:hypothetical protein